MNQDEDDTLVIEIPSEDGAVVALVPSGFIYKGHFHGRALSHAGWKRVTIPYANLIAILR